MTIKKLQAEIADQALKYVKPNNPCVEKPSNRGGCIDELKCYFYNSGKSSSCSKIGSEAYCAITAWSLVHKAFRNVGIDTAILSKIKTARAVDLMNFSRNNGVVVDKNVKIGDIFYRKSGDPSASGHVGIVVGFDNNYFYTVEGNNSFKLNGTKYQGVWEWKYPFSDIPKRGFEFIHIGEYVGTPAVAYTYRSPVTDVAISYSGGDGLGFTYTQILLVAGAIGAGYYLTNKYLR